MLAKTQVTPSNIMVADCGERIVLGDLGLAAFLPEGSDFVLGRSGTPGFLAPECYENLGATKRGMGWGCVDRWMGGWIWMAGWKLTGGG